MNDFYVYEHWRPDTNQCFYVGKGRGSRARHSANRRAHWDNIVSKLKREGLRLEIRYVMKGLTNEQAVALEIERIAYWRAMGVVLVNNTDGGEGRPGSVHSKEVKNKISLALTGRKLSAEHAAKVKSRTITDEWRANISAARLGKKPWNFGKPTLDMDVEFTLLADRPSGS